MKQLARMDEQFQKMEDDVLKQVTATAKAMIESLKFRMLFGTAVTPDQNRKTLAALKKFRSKHWGSKSDVKRAYKKYLSLY